jgi:hypothetical protein
VDEQKKQTIFDAPKVIAIGIASPAATLLTSRFGIAGTLLGLALSAMILTAVADFLKVYLARTSHAAHAAATAATRVPGALKAPRVFPPSYLFRRKGRTGTKAPYHGFSSPPGGRWRRWSLFLGRSVVAAGISFLLGLGAVTALEQSAGKSLTCWVWEECPAQSSDDEGGGSSDQSTRPSIFGGGPSAGSGTAAEVRPAGTQQGPTPPSGTLKGSSSQTPSKAAGSVDSSGGTDDQRRDQAEQQQDSSYYYSQEEYEQQSSSTTSNEEESQWREYRDGGPADAGEETRGEYEVSSVPWST